MRLAILGGTFNPIHNAHVEMARITYQNLDYDKIFFIPNNLAPHKKLSNINPQDRKIMVELAINDYNWAKIEDFELRVAELSYTINTVRYLYKSYEISGKLALIIGSDSFNSFTTWYAYKELLEAVDLIVVKRYNIDLNKSFSKEIKIKHLFEMDLDISSAEIRDRVKASKNISKFVHRDVEKYIYTQKIYLGQ